MSEPESFSEADVRHRLSRGDFGHDPLAEELVRKWLGRFDVQRDFEAACAAADKSAALDSKRAARQANIAATIAAVGAIISAICAIISLLR